MSHERLARVESTVRAQVADLVGEAYFEMPGMDGMELLREIQQRSPDTVRLMLTGHSEIDIVLRAVNEGAVFQFLTKPCPGEDLARAVERARRQHELIRSERQLLEQTLAGSIAALADALGVASPAAYGRSSRLRDRVRSVLQILGEGPMWEAEVAAQLSGLGALAAAESDRAGPPPGDDLPERLLAHIPRLDGVRQVLRYRSRRWDGGGPPKGDWAKGADIPLGSRVLAVCAALEAEERDGAEPARALAALESDPGAFDPEILTALRATVEQGSAARSERWVTVDRLVEAMRLEEEVRTKDGLLLALGGTDLNELLIAKLQNFARQRGIKQPIRVSMVGGPSD